MYSLWMATAVLKLWTGLKIQKEFRAVVLAMRVVMPGNGRNSAMPATLLSEVVKLSICIITLSIGTGFLQAIEPATGRMGFLAEKLRQGESISAGFLGGSITQGSGASSHSKCYYWLTRTWLSKEAEKRGSSSKSLLAAVGGTNSTYGAFRVGGQLLDKDIDLLIIEFAVNDYSSKEAAAAMEGIVRQAWTRNPQMGIVFLYTTSNRINQTHYAKGDMPPSVRQHHQIAEHYGIVEVNAGKAAATAITDGDYSSQEFFKDGTHPTDIGHAFYAKHLQEALLPLLDLPMPTETPILPVPIVSDRFEYARMLPLSPDDMDEAAPPPNPISIEGPPITTTKSPTSTPSPRHQIAE